MKQSLLTSLFTVAAAGMVMAAPPADIQKVQAIDKATVTTIKDAKMQNVKTLAPGITLSIKNGIKKLHTLRLADTQTTIRKQAPRKAESTLPEGYVLFESFEAWDGTTPDWTPDGWTVDQRGDVERAQSWTPSAANPLLPPPTDGNCYYGINFANYKQDEWLISPSVKVEDGMILSYSLYLEPAYLFNMENVDWDKYEFIGEKTVAATLQIWAQPEGGEWTMLHDYVDDYKDMSLLDMLYLTPTALEKKTIGLENYVGQNIKVAFRYVGTDGNTMFIDAIGVGFPALEDISYMDPFSTLYWGFERGWEMSGIATDIAIHPVYTPLTWTNMSYIEGATFTWDYCDPVTAEIVTCDDPDALVVTYVPDYTSESSVRNNFFYPPTLNAAAPGATPGSYTAPYTFFQAGGMPERSLNDGSEFKGSMFPFGFNNFGLTFVSVDDPTIGDPSIPVFGYSPNVDTYWLNYSLNGEEAIAGDYSHLEGIGNIFFATEAPLVVNGITVHGWGKIGTDAELTATIYGLNAEMSTDFTTFTTIASSTIKGSDILAEYSDSKGYLALPFNFDTPAVVQATAEHPAFVFMLSGFRSDKVEYFAPLQSQRPDPNYMCLGYILNHIDLSNHIADRPAYYSFKNMVYKEDGDYVDIYGAFAIGINGEYPWLTTECNGLELTADQTSAETALGSYFDGSKLTVEAPAGLTATVSGRYDKCVLHVERSESNVDVEGEIKVSGPGVEVTIPVKSAAVSGIDNITSAGATVTGIYDLSGRRVEGASNGLYIVKYSDGSVRKTFVK